MLFLLLFSRYYCTTLVFVIFSCYNIINPEGGGRNMYIDNWMIPIIRARSTPIIKGIQVIRRECGKSAKFGTETMFHMEQQASANLARKQCFTWNNKQVPNWHGKSKCKIYTKKSKTMNNKEAFTDIYNRMMTKDYNGYATLAEYANDTYGFTLNELLIGLAEIAETFH